MPLAIVDIVIKIYRVLVAHVHDDLAGHELDAQLQFFLFAPDSKEKSVVDAVGAEAQHQEQVRAGACGEQGAERCLHAGSLREDDS